MYGLMLSRLSALVRPHPKRNTLPSLEIVALLDIEECVSNKISLIQKTDHVKAVLDETFAVRSPPNG